MTITVEDFLERLSRCILYGMTAPGFAFTDWHISFITNVTEHVQAGDTLSTEQARIILRIGQTFRTQIVDAKVLQAADLDAMLANPTYRKQPYLSSRIPRQVRYLGDNLLGFRFKFNDIIITELKQLGDRCFGAKPRFDRDFRIWLAPVNRLTLRSLQQMIIQHRFETDGETRDYLKLAQHSLNHVSTFLVDEETGAMVGNVCDNELLATWVTCVAGGLHV